MILDKPIKTKKEDLLGHEPLAVCIAEAITNLPPDALSESFVVGIEGSWGSGKTSLINLVLEELLVVLLDSNDLSDRQIGFLYKTSKLIPREKRFESLRGILNSTKGVFVPTWFVDLITRETEEYETANEYKKATEFQNGPSLAGGEVRSLSEICVEKIRKSAENGSLEKERRLQYLLSFWKKCGHEKSVKDYVSKLLETEDGLFRFLESYIYCYAGIHVSIDRNRSLEQVGEVVDLNDLRERMNQVDVNGLGREKAGIISFCQEFLQSVE